MTEEQKSFIKNPKRATFRVVEYHGVYNKVEIAKLLNISRPTLDTRLKQHNWRLGELQLITEHFPVLA